MSNPGTTSARAALANSRGALSVLELAVGFALMDVMFIVLAVFTYGAGSEDYQALLRGMIIAMTASAAVTGIFSAIGRAGRATASAGRESR